MSLKTVCLARMSRWIEVGAVVEAVAVLRTADVDEPAGLNDAGRRLEQQDVGDGEDLMLVVAPMPMASDSAAVTAKSEVAAHQPRGMADVLQP